jgi:hypothetical protein
VGGGDGDGDGDGGDAAGAPAAGPAPAPAPAVVSAGAVMETLEWLNRVRNAAPSTCLLSILVECTSKEVGDNLVVYG